MSSKLHEFKITHGPWPVIEPTEEHDVVNPLSLLLCRIPLGGYLSNPNFALIHARTNKYMTYTDSLYTILTSASDEPINRPTKASTQTFWMKTYSENKGILELLEGAGILRRTGQTVKQGFVDLIAVETVLVSGQWANVCHNPMCGTREQMDWDGERMKHCAKCKEAYYCNAECQKAHWPEHKNRCKILKRAAEQNSAPENAS